jgi:hypothetical protein
MARPHLLAHQPCTPFLLSYSIWQGVAANWNGVLAVLMFLWWGVGTCVLTIHGKVNGGLGSMFTVASAGANGTRLVIELTT